MNGQTFPAVDDQLRTLRRGAASIIVEAELRLKLERARSTGRPLVVKLGLDPTAPDLHLGHTVVLGKLRDFQDLGHEIVVVIGDFTGMIGDPTGHSETRKPLTWEQIRANAATYRTQLGAVLDMERVRVEFNSTWLGALKFEDLIRLTAHLTVAQMLQREDFASRYASARAISLHEFLYPVAQAYDSVALKADVELGGTDQTFNLLVGRDLQRATGQEPQVTLTVPLLEGLDGVQKMSKSLGNYVGIIEPADSIFGKLMSIPDALMWKYFELLTRLDESEIAALRAGHPMDAKKRLASTITAQYHGHAAATAAQDQFVRIFQQRQDPEAADVVTLDAAAVGAEDGATGVSDASLVKVLVAAGLTPSSSEARRMIRQGAVDIDGERVADVNARMTRGEHLVRVGKRVFKRIVLR